MLSWNEQDSGTIKTATLIFPYNYAIGERRVRLRRPLTQPCEGAIDAPGHHLHRPRQRHVGSVRRGASRRAAPWSRTTPSSPQVNFVLNPAPAVKMATEYRPISDGNSEPWQGSLPIGTSGRSISFYHSPLSSLRQAFPGFQGFEYRLKDAPDVTAQCTWELKDDVGTNPPPTTTRTAASLSTDARPLNRRRPRNRRRPLNRHRPTDRRHPRNRRHPRRRRHPRNRLPP